jgi:hypothetical protein
MLSFGTIMITLLVGFGCAFYVLYTPPGHLPGSPFGSMSGSIYQCFKIGILGDYDPGQIEESASPFLMTVLVTLVQVIVLVVMVGWLF